MDDDSDVAEIEEVSPTESAWIQWRHSQSVDTGGHCNCGHEGLGIDWHHHDCPAVRHLLETCARQLYAVVWNQWAFNHADRCNNVDYLHDDGSECHWPLPEFLRS